MGWYSRAGQVALEIDKICTDLGRLYGDVAGLQSRRVAATNVFVGKRRAIPLQVLDANPDVHPPRTCGEADACTGALAPMGSGG